MNSRVWITDDFVLFFRAQEPEDRFSAFPDVPLPCDCLVLFTIGTLNFRFTVAGGPPRRQMIEAPWVKRGNYGADVLSTIICETDIDSLCVVPRTQAALEQHPNITQDAIDRFLAAEPGLLTDDLVDTAADPARWKHDPATGAPRGAGPWRRPPLMSDGRDVPEVGSSTLVNSGRPVRPPQ